MAGPMAGLTAGLMAGMVVLVCLLATPSAAVLTARCQAQAGVVDPAEPSELGGRSSAGAAAFRDLTAALAEVDELVKRHRYAQVVELLEPFADRIDDPAWSAAERYAVAAELGRACFHLGDYAAAHGYLTRAVVLEPRRIETALYLQASAFLTGRRDEALAIFEEVVRSGAPDLYLAVTLPGERRFLADPEVWSLIDRHARPITMSLREGGFESIRPGQPRKAVEDALGVRSPDPVSTTLTARAGPEVIWAFRFSDAGALEEIAVRAESVLRYTPYRLHFDNELDWRLRPEQAITLLGPAASTTTAEGSLSLGWDLPGCSLSLAFGRPTGPVPPALGSDQMVLQLVRIRRRGE